MKGIDEIYDTGFVIRIMATLQAPQMPEALKLHIAGCQRTNRFASEPVAA